MSLGKGALNGLFLKSFLTCSWKLPIRAGERALKSDSQNIQNLVSFDEEMRQIVEAVKKFGPRNISKIARETKLPIETVRYRIGNQLRSMGIRFHISINYLKLGLIRSWIVLDFPAHNLRSAPDLLDLLSKKGYLTYYARVLPYGSYLAISTIPYSAINKYRELLDELVRLDVLREYRMVDLQYLKHFSLRPEFYDFATRTWNIPWNTIDAVEKRDDKPIQIDYSRSVIDKTDLLILKELQINASQTIATIAKKIEMPEKNVRYHYKAHLVGSKIIDGYIVRWQGDKYHSDNKYIFSCFIEFTDINQKDLINIFRVVESIPFTWFISLSVDKTHLVSQFFVPVTFYYDFLAYLSNRLNVYKEKYELFIVDIDSAKAYTLPFESYNDKTGWNTDIDELISFFRDKVRAMSKSHMTDYAEK